MTLEFAPFIPWIAIAALAVLAIVLSVLGFLRGVRGTAIRLAASIAVLAALANPLLLQEERDPLTTVVPVIVDRSQSSRSPAVSSRPIRRCRPSATASAASQYRAAHR